MPSVRPRTPGASMKVGARIQRLAAPDQAVAFGDPPGQGEQERDRQLGRRRRQHAGRVGDDDVPTPRLVEVDVVDADRVVRHDAKLRARGIEKLSVDPVGRRGHEAVRTRRAGQQLLPSRRVRGVVLAQVEQPVELLPDTLRNAPRDEDAGQRALTGHPAG